MVLVRAFARLFNSCCATGTMVCLFPFPNTHFTQLLSPCKVVSCLPTTLMRKLAGASMLRSSKIKLYKLRKMVSILVLSLLSTPATLLDRLWIKLIWGKLSLFVTNTTSWLSLMRSTRITYTTQRHILSFPCARCSTRWATLTVMKLSSFLCTPFQRVF